MKDLEFQLYHWKNAARAQKDKLNHLHDEMTKMEGLLIKMEVWLLESEMSVGLLREELRGKSKVVDSTGEEEENEELNVLELPFVLALAQWEEGKMFGSHILVLIPQMPVEVFDQALQEVGRVSGWGEMVLEKNPELPEAQIELQVV